MVELVEQMPLVRVAQADSAASALDQASREQPSIVLLDAALPDLVALEAVRQLKVAAPRSAVVLVSNEPVDAYRETAVRSGAALCLGKEGLAAELLPALLRLRRGEIPAPGADPAAGSEARQSVEGSNRYLAGETSYS